MDLMCLPLFYKHEILYEWINPAYLEMDYQMQIQEEFEERSEILLKEFLKVRHHSLLYVCCWGVVLLKLTESGFPSCSNSYVILFKSNAQITVISTAVRYVYVTSPGHNIHF